VPSLWADAADNAKPYTIKNGVVDPHTFTGYLRYGETCHWCHGAMERPSAQSGVGGGDGNQDQMVATAGAAGFSN
jgi:hypothetical protein